MTNRILRFLLFLGTVLVTTTTTAAADDDPERTVLQKHVDFFDRDGDGFITVRETKQGLDAIGFPGPSVTTWLAATAIHTGLPATHGGGGIFFRRNTIDTSIIEKGIHPSDSGSYNAEGGYVEEKFQAIFDTYDTDKNNAMDQDELGIFHQEKREDFRGNLISRAEWGALMLVAGEDNAETGLRQLPKDSIFKMFDGTLFYELEAKQNARRNRLRY